MAVRTSAKYSFGLPFARFMALNDDLTIPTVVRIIGGAGPFDFSGVTLATEVELNIQFDNGDAEELDIDISGAASQSAVTVAELVDAINTATPTDMLASAEAVTGRLKLECTDTDTPPDYIQVWGECAELAMIGQGFGQAFVKTDTLTSVGDTPMVKDEETFTTTDAKGLDTEVISDGYRKGFEASIVDTAEDWELLALIEGGSYDSVTNTYEVPTSEDFKVYFFAEIFYAQYAKGSNKEADLEGYVKKIFRSCKGAVGDKTHERGFADGNYTIKGTSYKDEDGVMHGDTLLEYLSVTEYEVLDLYNV
jgi:hypothetical protein